MAEDDPGFSTTAVAAGRLFWGLDSTDFLIDFLTHPNLFDDAEMTRLESLPEAARRN